MSIIQNLLDEGNSMYKVATILGVHHTTITRLRDRGKIEIYVPFDEGGISKVSSSKLDSLLMEDKLESILYGAFDGEILIDREEYGMWIDVGKYVRETYISLKNYFIIKGFSEVMCNVLMKCPQCKNIEHLNNWYERDDRVWGLRSECPSCQLGYCKDWQGNNPEYMFMINTKRRELHMPLPYDFDKKAWERLREEHLSRCAITRNFENLSIDHFIPITTGHGGTYFANLILLSRSKNSSKKGSNPFEWCSNDGQVSCFERMQFDLTVKKLASANALTPQEYRQFVYWCHENPRTVDEIKADQRHSIEIWREATGIQFPLPSYTSTYTTLESREKGGDLVT
ncbi:helix-turn-helix domain-containing protein [Bacillus sp. JJ722]|uniref:helix-turn-helix domain-containing protein n=1 Tax=Bacillus sp. JJ722 TaxID=3122973 RepID=UPI002FFD9771